MREPCAYADCNRPATFEVIDVADRDAHTAVVHACPTHLGELVGHAPSVPELPPTHEEWHVHPYEGDPR